MTDAEKKLCLALILADIRSSWGENLEDRLEDAEDLATELNLINHIVLIEAFREEIARGDADGRIFRTTWDNGGYENHEAAHGLKPDYNTVSREVIIFLESTLNYPEYSLENWPEE